MKAIRVLLFITVLMSIAAIATLFASKLMLARLEDQNACNQKVIIGTECELTYHDVYGYEIGYPFPYQQTGMISDSALNIRNLAIDYTIWLGATTLIVLPNYVLMRRLVTKIKRK